MNKMGFDIYVSKCKLVRVFPKSKYMGKSTIHYDNTLFILKMHVKTMVEAMKMVAKFREENVKIKNENLFKKEKKMVIIDVEYKCTAIKTNTICVTDDVAEKLKRIKNKNIYHVTDICGLDFCEFDNVSIVKECDAHIDENVMIIECLSD